MTRLSLFLLRKISWVVANVAMHSITTQDHGTWKCRAFAADENGLSVGHSVDIEVFVAVPPQNVILTMDKEPLKGDSVTLRLGSDQSGEIEFECHALGARPAPKFKWLVGEAEVEAGDVEDRPEAVRPDNDGKRDYAQVLKYTPSPKDTGQSMRCRGDLLNLGFSILPSNIASDTPFLGHLWQI